jgi:hypothetical protein
LNGCVASDKDCVVKTKSWLNRTVVMLTLVSLTQDAASELLYPLLPVLLTTILGAPPLLWGLSKGAPRLLLGLRSLSQVDCLTELGESLSPVLVMGWPPWAK